jgi:hypothetical protein
VRTITKHNKHRHNNNDANRSCVRVQWVFELNRPPARSFLPPRPRAPVAQTTPMRQWDAKIQGGDRFSSITTQLPKLHDYNQSNENPQASPLPHSSA